MGDGSSDDGAIVREATPEVELGPPLDLSAPFVPRPATESLWLIRVRCAADCFAGPSHAYSQLGRPPVRVVVRVG